MPNFLALDRLKADLDILRPLDKEQEARILQKFRLDWNYHSNAIEGNSLTLGETRSLLLHGLTAKGKPLRDHLDIRGHNDAVLWLEEIVRDDRPLTENFIREIHEVLLGEPYFTPAQTPSGQPTQKRVEPGRYKTQPNNVVTTTGEPFFFASPEETPARMTALIDWYRAELAAPTLHPVELAARFHYQFVRIHPFDDGNGRMSRLLMNLILLRHGYPMTVIKRESRDLYIAALSQADAEEMEPFLEFIAENVEASLQLMLRGARGESIEEPSDLDKKLALLKKQVLTREDTIEMIWNMNAQPILYATAIQFWLADFFAQMQRFDELFLITETKIRIINVGDKEQEMTNNIALLQEHVELVMKGNEQLVKIIVLRIKWQEFRVASNTFSQGALLAFEFHKHTFSVSFGIYDQFKEGSATNSIQVFSSLYKPEYDHARIQEINHQLATKVYGFIEAKLAEPPTT